MMKRFLLIIALLLPCAVRPMEESIRDAWFWSENTAELEQTYKHIQRSVSITDATLKKLREAVKAGKGFTTTEAFPGGAGHVMNADEAKDGLLALEGAIAAYREALKQIGAELKARRKK